jgi:catechol 2,3-dioxygenase-like lactoylglutathione lyase family enzyme
MLKGAILMQEFKSVNHVSIAVNNMDETLNFYQNTLGFEFVQRIYLDWADAELALLKLNGQGIEFICKKDTPRLQTNRWEVGHIAFEVSDIYKVADELRTISNLKFVDEKPVQANEHLICFFFQGPSGELIELVQYV